MTILNLMPESPSLARDAMTGLIGAMLELDGESVILTGVRLDEDEDLVLLVTPIDLIDEDSDGSDPLEIPFFGVENVTVY